MNMRCRFMAERICVNISALSVTSTSTLREGGMPFSSVLRIGGVPWRMFISIGTASDTPAPTFFTSAHEHRHELVAGGKELVPEDARAFRIPSARRRSQQVRPRALEKAEHDAAP